MEGERRLGPLVVVRRLGAEAGAAATGCEVVERSLEPVAAEEPVEGVLCPQPVLGIAGDGEGGELGERRGGGPITVAPSATSCLIFSRRAGRMVSPGASTSPCCASSAIEMPSAWKNASPSVP